jgi:anti-sigma factor ChrR (cupin superfamily)
MRLNSDFSKRVVVHAPSIAWVDSPSSGVQRRMLERDGGEVARATSIVRYDAGSSFDRHTHELGEEILVLDGVFTDETGRFGTGTYLRNPPGSSHAPGSESGCTLFVKLRHLSPSDQQHRSIDTTVARWRPGLVPGLSVLPLSEFESEQTAMVRWAPGTQFNPHRHYGGEEIYVVDGVFEDEFGRYPAGTWIRSPHLSVHKPSSIEGCTIFVKTGHLPLTVDT